MNYLNEIKKTHAKLPVRDCILYYLIGLSGEVGELQELFKKRIFRDKKVLDHDIKRELGDVYCYLTLLIDLLGFDLNEIQQLNIEKLKERGLLK